MRLRPVLFGATMALCCLSGLSVADEAGRAQEQALRQRGLALAQTHCAVCHAVGVNDESPTWVNSNTPFRRLHERFPVPMLLEAEKTGTISGHDEMPGFTFSLDEMDALLAYIDSLSPTNARYRKGPGQN